MNEPARILHLRETGSTNADAMRLALKGEDLPLWVIADRQTAGRGRAGRTWTSPPGNLYASLAFCCEAPIEQAGQLSLIAGISLIDAIRTNTELAPDAGLRLKWPNDVLVGLSKVGGILVESTMARGSPGFLARRDGYCAPRKGAGTSRDAQFARRARLALARPLACRIGFRRHSQRLDRARRPARRTDYYQYVARAGFRHLSGSLRDRSAARRSQR